MNKGQRRRNGQGCGEMQRMHEKQTRAVFVETLLILIMLWTTAFVIYKELPSAVLILPAAGLASALLIASACDPKRAESVGRFCFHYRWALALLVLCLCVCLRLHGSSIGIYDETFPTQIEAGESTLFGTPRWIRSDEFGVSVPTFFSQAANGYRLYSRQMSLSSTNMVLDYYSPAWDWTAIGKPMNWGFLLFGNEVGLSWYWCSEILLLFMTAWEMCLILTGDRRLESLLGAVMITLSPAIQWWVIPHMPIVILYSMALFCLGYRFFTAKTRPAGWIYAGLAIIAAVGFALSFFPSFQVPCAYTVLALLIACLWRDRGLITFTRKQWLRIVLPSVAVLLILTRFLLSSRENLALLLNTVYPGRRVSMGGTNSIRDLFADIASLFLPYKDIPYSNNCEVSTAIHFAPFFLALSPRILSGLKQKNDSNVYVGRVLAWILVLQMVFMLVGIPRWLAEITLLRFCNRMFQVYQWTAVLFTVWGFSVLLNDPTLLNRYEKVLYPLGYGVVCFFLINDNLRRYIQFQLFGRGIGRLLILISILIFVLILLLAAYRKKRLFSALLVLLMFFCGGTVNPVEHGIGAVTNHPISAAIAEIAEQEPESRWLCTDCTFFLSDFVMANGARVLDAMNFYPDNEKWGILDPAGTYRDITNRYANQSALLTEGETFQELVSGDYIEMHLNPECLKALGIRYLFTPADHAELLNRYGIRCEYVTGQDRYGIFRLSWDAGEAFG